MKPHDGPVGGAEGLRVRQVGLPVGDEPGQPRDVFGPRARLGQHRADILERLSRLRGEVVGLEAAGFRVPADLPADEHQAPRRGDAVGIPLGPRPAVGLENLDHRA